MTSALRGVGDESGVSKCSGRPIFILFYFFIIIKENWICAMIRHYAEANIKISLTINLPFGSDVRQCRHPLMIPFYCLWPTSN